MKDDAKVLVTVDDKDGLIVAKDGDKAIDMGDGLTSSVIGPMLVEAEAVQEEDPKWLADQQMTRVHRPPHWSRCKKVSQAGADVRPK